MDASPQSNNLDDNVREFLKTLIGEDGLAFLSLDEAVASLKQGELKWQAPFFIGLRALPSLYPWKEAEGQGTERPALALLVLLMAQRVVSTTDEAIEPRVLESAIEPLRTIYASLPRMRSYGSSDERGHALFHVRFALGVLLLMRGEYGQATKTLREMAAVETSRRGGRAFSTEGLAYWDVEVVKALAAIILQAFYAGRQDYETALYLLTEAVASNGSGRFSDGLLAVVPALLDLFAQKCEASDTFEEWVDLFDRAAAIVEVCGEADVEGELPATCKATSPQFLAWKFGQLAARFAVRRDMVPGGAGQLLPWDYYGDDWLNGTTVASLLCEHDEHRSWHTLRHDYLAMWQCLPRYQWLRLCEAGTQTDLYWAMRIGFADKILEAEGRSELVPARSEASSVAGDIRALRGIASATAVRGMRMHQDVHETHEDVHKTLELLREVRNNQPANKEEILEDLQQSLRLVWSKLPSKVVEDIIKAERLHRTEVNTDEAKGWFHKAVEASFNYCFVYPLIGYLKGQPSQRMTVGVPIPQGGHRELLWQTRSLSSKEIPRLSLWQWSCIFDRLGDQAQRDVVDLKKFIELSFGKMNVPAVRELSRAMRDFSQRRDSQHDHGSRYEEETTELDQMRELVFGTRRRSIITQIFQVFGGEEKP